MTILSEREKEILSLACLSNVQIARRLNITTGTVKFMFSQMRQKFGVKNRTALLLKAVESGELNRIDMGFWTPLGDYIPDIQFLDLRRE